MTEFLLVVGPISFYVRQWRLRRPKAVPKYFDLAFGCAQRSHRGVIVNLHYASKVGVVPCVPLQDDDSYALSPPMPP